MKLRLSPHASRAWLGVALLALSACGGGGGGGGGGGNPPPQSPSQPPTVTLTAAQTTIEQGQSTQLTWSSTNATACTASGGWSGALATSGTQSSGVLTATATFTLSCTGAGGANQTSVVVTVQPPPSVDIDATHRILRAAQTSQLSWTSTRVNTCEAQGEWTGTRPTSGSETVGPFATLTSSQHTFILQCAGTSGPASDSVVVVYRTGVNMAPTAHAGADVTVFSTQSVELVGTFSSDDHGVASARWTQTSGPSVTLQPVSVAINIGFVAPIVTSDTVLTFSLVVIDDEGVESAPDFVDVTVKPIPPTVTLTGDVQVEIVPHGSPGTGLSYPGKGFVSMSAPVLVEALNASNGAVVASGAFTGEFQLTVPSQTELMLRATAQLSRQPPAAAPHWLISVRDLDPGGAPVGNVYSYTGPSFNSGAGGRRSLQIPSGWNTSGQLTGPRHAAPFAILHAIWSSLDRLSTLTPAPSLPELVIDWGPSNTGGQTFYATDGAGRHRIVLAGEVNVDTDEYDPAVIRHELGHFFLNTTSRDESVGGPHTLGDRLDMRVAYSEGFATAFGALSSGQSAYLDSFGFGQRNSGFFSLDSDSTLREGWYNEFSVHELLWRVSDLQAIWQVLRTPMVQTDALTSVFPFFTALKQLQPANAAIYDTLLVGEQIFGPTIEPFGSTETNNASSANVLPIYGSITLGGGSVVVRSTNEFGEDNKLSSHRFLRFSLPATTNVRIQVTAAAGRDADFDIFRRGVPLGPVMGPENEDHNLTLSAGEYVLDVYDCGNAGCNGNVPPAPTDITVTLTPN